jgi:hypothetical protein
MKLLLRTVTVVTLFVALLACKRPAQTPQLTDPLGGAVLGIGLNSFADRLNTIINSAGTQGRLIAIEAGQQLWLTIYNAQQAYAAERDRTFRELDAVVQGNIQTLATALDQLEREGFARADEIMRQTQQVANTLPFSNKTPQVRGFSPSFVIHGAEAAALAASFRQGAPELTPDTGFSPVSLASGRELADSLLRLAATPAVLATAARTSRAELLPDERSPGVTPDVVRLEVNGNFADAAKPDYQPQLTSGETTLSPAVVTTQQLVFLVPRARFAVSPGATLGYTTFELRVPFKPGLLSRRQVARFNLMIASLPSIAGSIAFTGTTSSMQREWRNERRTGVIAQHSNDDDLDLVHCGPAPLDGWIVNPDSVAFRVESSEGQTPDDWRYYLQSTNPQPCYRVITVKRTWGTSGKLNFRIAWNEYRDRPVPSRTAETFQMRWGQSRVFQFTPGQWQAVLTTFDSIVPQEFSDAASFRNRFLRVTQTSTHVTLMFPRADEIRW